MNAKARGVTAVTSGSESSSTEILEPSRRIVISITDITRLEQAQGAMEEPVRSKDEFIASISHELRTPLTGVTVCRRPSSNGHVTDGEEPRPLPAVVVKQSEEVS